MVGEGELPGLIVPKREMQMTTDQLETCAMLSKYENTLRCVMCETRAYVVFEGKSLCKECWTEECKKARGEIIGAGNISANAGDDAGDVRSEPDPPV